MKLPAKNSTKSSENSELGSTFSQSAEASKFRIMFKDVYVPHEIEGDSAANISEPDNNDGYSQRISTIYEGKVDLYNHRHMFNKTQNYYKVCKEQMTRLNFVTNPWYYSHQNRDDQEWKVLKILVVPLASSCLKVQNWINRTSFVAPVFK